MREELSRNLLDALQSIPHADIEPNGLHLAYKVRDVAVGLLACPSSLPDAQARRGQAYVREFTNALSWLDGSETVNTANLQSWVDADRYIGS